MTGSEKLPSLKWVRLQKYCELSGDTSHAVHARRRRGEWLNGVQCRLGRDKKLWVNLHEVEKWIERANPSHVVMQPKWQQA
jgi:hypothetical protein